MPWTQHTVRFHYGRSMWQLQLLFVKTSTLTAFGHGAKTPFLNQFKNVVLLTFFTARTHETWWADAFSHNMVAYASIQAVRTVLVTKDTPFLRSTTWGRQRRESLVSNREQRQQQSHQGGSHGRFLPAQQYLHEHKC